MIAVREVSGIVTARPENILRNALYQRLLVFIEFDEIIFAVMLHGIALGQRPAAGGREAAGTAVLLVHHGAGVKNRIFIAKSQCPKQIQNDSGVVRGYNNITVIIAVKHFLLIRS